MKHIILAFLLSASANLHAQSFWIDAEPETMTGAFNTFLENDAFDKAKLLPRRGDLFFIPALIVDSIISPAEVGYRTAEPPGWDVVVFYESEYRTDAYHLDFAGRREVSYEDKIAWLERIKSSP